MGVEAAAAVSARGWGWQHAGRADWAVRGLDLDIASGERVLLLGASGAGKSTILHAIAGVLGGDEEGISEGTLLVDGVHPTRVRGRVGLVQQDPEANVVLARVGDDVAFGCENAVVPRELIWPRVRRALDAVHLDVPLDQSTTALSGGQKQRLAIAGALAQQDGSELGRLLLLDEPTANLDPAGIGDVRDTVLNAVADRSVTLIIVEHRVKIWADLVDRVLVLDADGGLLADGPPGSVLHEQRERLLAAGVWVPGVPNPFPDAVQAPVRPPAIAAAGLDIGYEPGKPIRTNLDATWPAGVSTVVTGPNGSGKTTLALTMAGLLPRLGGTLTAAGDLRPPARPARRWRGRAAVVPEDPATWASRDLMTRIGTVFQEPEHQFVTGSVRQELAVGLHALDWPQDRIDARIEELLALLHLERLVDANPFTLSGGEKRRLSVGTVLGPGPSIVVLDEPTFGQDRNTWIDLVTLVLSMLDDRRTVVSVTHDEAYLMALGQHHIALEARP